MESFSKKQTEESHEREHEYNFEGLKEIEGSMRSLVDQLRENFERGAYDIIVSDEAGGRIPSLILWKVARKINPSKDLSLSFLSGGQGGNYFPVEDTNPEQWKILMDHVKKHVARGSHALIVSQYLHTGGGVDKMAEILRDAGISHVDAAIVDARKGYEKGLQHIDAVLVGSHGHSALHEDHQQFSGVRKIGIHATKKEHLEGFDRGATPWKERYQPFPARVIDAVALEGRGQDLFPQKEFEKNAGITDRDTQGERTYKIMTSTKLYDDLYYQELSDDEKRRIQEDIVKAREDVSRMADRLLNPS